MWQNLLVGIIVGVATGVVLRTLWRNITGRRACDVDQCASCPFSEGCEHHGKPDEESS